MEETKELTQEEIIQLKNQQELLENLKLSNPRAYFKLITGGNYTPWMRYDNGENKKAYRNSKCTCGSNKKTKHCCGIKTEYKIKIKVKDE